MPMNFIGRTSPVDQLKASMDVSSQRVRAIADRVARASTGEPVFSLSLSLADGAVANPTLGPVDVESEMVNLADEQLRYEAAAKLLEKTYAGLRASLQER
jgi:flagellar basal body rod protein FlgB